MKSALPYTKKKRIFIFDRNDAFREALTLLFKGKHRIYGFSNIAEVSKKQRIKPDVIILDVLPTTRTHELVRIIDVLKKAYKKIPILILSTNKKAFQRARRIGIKHYLEKPFEIEIFQRKINVLVK